MQYQVPQFIETEDKIVGPFSLRQFLYIAAGAGISFFMFFTLQTAVWVILSVFVVGGSIALAVVKVNGRTLPTVILMAIRFYIASHTYVWQPENPGVPKNAETVSAAVGGGIDLERIVSGFTLKRTWASLQTGERPKFEPDAPHEASRLQAFRKSTGERRTAKRVDYR